ncbi:MAG: FAD-binding protein [Alphaproteobacteria bacterium]
MTRTLIIAEHDNATLNPATLHAVAAGAKLGFPMAMLVAGHGSGEVAKQAAKVAGIAEVLAADAGIYAHGLAETLAPLVAEQAKGFSHVIAAATSFGKNLLPRVAALCDVAQISDIIGIESADIFVRPIYAGNAIATVQSSDALKIITVRGTAFPGVAAEGGSATVTAIVPAAVTANGSRFVSHELSQSSRPELTAAKIVVSGGRGLGSAENFKLIEALADKLGAAVGASRAAVDAGYVPNDYQVGQTGKMVAPELYIAIGISGAIQHLAGMSNAKVIVAINKDPDAPIFQIADYGLVGDLFQILPELTAAL